MSFSIHEPTLALTRDVYSVSRLVREARGVLETRFPSLWVEGELSNLARPASGHLYFSLKDQECQVRCAMFRSRRLALGFQPQNGMHVLVRAKVSLYEGRGEFQLIVEYLEPAGEGALRLAFEQLKRRLAAEGLFAEEHKSPLPAFPNCVGVVTSPTGAAIRDILTVMRRRFPAIPIVVYPVPVQGEGAAGRIAEMLALAERRGECDILILARGGGSLEDLWPFNEEQVARAIFACRIPTVSAIGHEIDYTIADFVADRRAPTPSAAAEMVSPDQGALLRQLNAKQMDLLTRTRHRLSLARHRAEATIARLLHPGQRLQELSQRADDLTLRLQTAMISLLSLKAMRFQGLALRPLSAALRFAAQAGQVGFLQQRLLAAVERQQMASLVRIDALDRALHAVSPLGTLERGYAIVSRLPERTLVRSVNQAHPGAQIEARLACGYLYCRVETSVEIEPDAAVDEARKS
ncbi:MAG: exodeoxyribonuclease VII large subunit [Gammaproteobacteria bacterium]